MATFEFIVYGMGKGSTSIPKVWLENGWRGPAGKKFKDTFLNVYIVRVVA